MICLILMLFVILLVNSIVGYRLQYPQKGLLGMRPI